MESLDPNQKIYSSSSGVVTILAVRGVLGSQAKDLFLILWRRHAFPSVLFAQLPLSCELRIFSLSGEHLFNALKCVPLRGIFSSTLPLKVGKPKIHHFGPVLSQNDHLLINFDTHRVFHSRKLL